MYTPRDASMPARTRIMWRDWQGGVEHGSRSTAVPSPQGMAPYIHACVPTHHIRITYLCAKPRIRLKGWGFTWLIGDGRDSPVCRAAGVGYHGDGREQTRPPQVYPSPQFIPTVSIARACLGACVLACLHACVLACTFMRARSFVHTYMCTRVQTHARMHACSCVHLCACARSCVCVCAVRACMFVRLCMCVCALMHGRTARSVGVVYCTSTTYYRLPPISTSALAHSMPFWYQSAAPARTHTPAACAYSSTHSCTVHTYSGACSNASHNFERHLRVLLTSVRIASTPH